MEADDILKQVEEKEREFDARYTRMDDDYASWKLIPSALDATLDYKTRKHASDIDIISNDLRTNCDDVQAVLSSADMQILISMAEPMGEDKRSDISKLERLFDYAFKKADERLVNQVELPLKDSLIWHACVRGWTAGRFLVYQSNDGVIFDFKAMDPRRVTYEVGDSGLMWSGYKFFRPKAAIEATYRVSIDGHPYGKPGDGSKKKPAVIDYWKREGENSYSNTVISGNTVLKPTTKHKMRSMPILIIPVATRPPVVDSSETDEIEQYGDSLFASIRDINGMHNRFVSIVASHANRLARQPMINYKDDQGTELTSTTNVPDAIINLSMQHNRLEHSPMPEISPTVISLMNWLGSRVRRGMLPDVQTGDPPPSGTLYNLVQEQGNKILNPRIRNLSLFYAGACRLIAEQLLEDKIKVKIQGVEKQKYYETQVAPVDLKKPHVITVELTARTPWAQLDVAQQAEMLKRLGLPDSWIWEHILKIQDPKGLADLAAIELFEHSPKGAMKRAVEALIETRGDIPSALSLINDMDKLEARENAELQSEVMPPEVMPPEVMPPEGLPPEGLPPEGLPPPPPPPPPPPEGLPPEGLPVRRV
tara:strand:+ start:3120 stop:4898 length:1779 start_codon:yes stop_codon:yes gene_type:complete